MEWIAIDRRGRGVFRPWGYLNLGVPERVGSMAGGPGGRGRCRCFLAAAGQSAIGFLAEPIEGAVNSTKMEILSMSTRSTRVRVSGEFDCFTQPEARVDRFSYPVITPSAARNLLDSICWRPQMRWIVTFEESAG